MAVLIDDTGVHVGDAAGPGPPSLLQRLGNGAYTAALVRGGRTDAGGTSLRIVDWHLHERRLVRSVGGGAFMGAFREGDGHHLAWTVGRGDTTRGATSLRPGQWMGGGRSPPGWGQLPQWMHLQDLRTTRA